MHFRLITGDHGCPCVNCGADVPARTIHTCPAFLTVEERREARLQAGILGGFCHCNGFFRGSDHCQCCGCEEHESTCDHVCDGITCVSTHDLQGRID